MKLQAIHNVFFIGVGGIGMSALARYFVANGKRVAGYDKTASPITESLSDLGVEVHYKDAVSEIPIEFLSSDSTLVVYTPAVPKTHTELNYFRDNHFIVLKRAEVLGLITKETFCFGVAGTHGKTTTSAILGHLMQPVGATAFLGGITENYQSNLILGKEDISVVEADEFDRSFLHLAPNIACVTSMDADHLDIYGEAAALESSFTDFANSVSDTLLVAKGLPLKGLTYAVDEPADYRAHDVRIEGAKYVFDVTTPTKQLKGLQFGLPGKHNLMNALAALAMADVYGVDSEVIKAQLESFKGVHRRFSYKIQSEAMTLIDDYAHHPTEIQAVVQAVRELYPEKKVMAIFQPHLFSRTRDFADDFARALAGFDELYLLDIYPARELPIPGITSEWLLEKIALENKQLLQKSEVLTTVKETTASVIVMIGAGDIGLLVNEVKEALKHKCSSTQ